MSIDVNKILFRASYTGDLMTDGDGIITSKQLKTIEEYELKPKLTDNQFEELQRLKNKRDNPELSLTTRKRLIKVYNKEKYGREDEVRSKYMEKGTIMEPDSITLISLVKKKMFKKNEKRIENKFITGLPDLFDEADDIMDAEEIIDVKSSWSLDTFTANKYINKLNHDYKWQGHSYLGLIPKAKRFRLIYALVNTPPELIMDEKKRLKFQNRYDELDPDYIEACKLIERNHIFDMELFRSNYPYFEFHNEEWMWDIPRKERIHEIVMVRDESCVDALYKRVKQCREWLSTTTLEKHLQNESQT